MVCIVEVTPCLRYRTLKDVAQVLMWRKIRPEKVMRMSVAGL
jgi:hypothetical protein